MVISVKVDYPGLCKEVMPSGPTTRPKLPNEINVRCTAFCARGTPLRFLASEMPRLGALRRNQIHRKEVSR